MRYCRCCCWHRLLTNSRLLHVRRLLPRKPQRLRSDGLSLASSSARSSLLRARSARGPLGCAPEPPGASLAFHISAAGFDISSASRSASASRWASYAADSDAAARASAASRCDCASSSARSRAAASPPNVANRHPPRLRLLLLMLLLPLLGEKPATAADCSSAAVS